MPLKIPKSLLKSCASAKTVMSAALLVAVNASGAEGERLPFYLGADLVRLTTRVDDRTEVAPKISGSAAGTTLRLRGGAHLYPWLDAEFESVLSANATYSTTGSANTVRANVFGAFTKPKITFGHLELYARLGASSTTLEFVGTKTSDRIGKTATSGFAYGAGAQYVLNRNIRTSVDYSQYNKGKLDAANTPDGLGVAVRALSLGITYTF